MSVISRPKQVIKDYCRHKRYSGPIYFLVQEEKIDLHKHYTVHLSINGVIASQGTGLSRRLAEFKAALSAIHIISQTDPNILDHIKTDKYGRTINRSFSVDYISNANRNTIYSSQIEDIDSMGIKSDLISSSNNVQNNRIDGETSSDEGVSVEGSESSSDVPSPKLQNKGNSTASMLHERSLKTSDTKSKFNFLTSLILLNSLRAISRRSFRRRPSFSSRKPGPLNNGDGEDNTNVSRPTSSSSSSTSSAFSSNSSISSCTPSASNGIHHHEEESLKLTEETLMKPGLITQSIMEEDEEEDNDDGAERNHIHKDIGQMSIEAGSKSNLSNTTNNSEYRLLRSLSSSYPLSNVCAHNHFSIYAPLLCNSTSSFTNKTIESSPTASLLRYCVRMYLPLPYYDIQYDKKFLVTCRIILTISEKNIGKLRFSIPKLYLDQEFTAKGSGDALKIARNMAAQKIIDKLKAADIYIEE